MADRAELIGASSFFLEDGGVAIGMFKEVSGLDIETEVITSTQSGKDGKVIILKSAGALPVKPGQVTAKYNATKDDKIMEWRQKVIDGKMSDARKNMSIVVYNVDNTEALRFNLKNAWPSKVSWSTLSSTSNDPVDITVIIEHEGMEKGK